MPRPAPDRFPPRAVAQAGFGDAADALHAIAGLLNGAGENDERTPEERLTAEARRFFRVPTAALLTAVEAEARVEVAALSPEGDPPLDAMAVRELPLLAGLLGSGSTYLWVSGQAVAELGHTLGALGASAGALLVQLPVVDRTRQVLVLLDSQGRGYANRELEVAGAFAAVAAASLAQLRLARDSAAQTTRQAALARAAKTLNESLDRNRVLVRICEEAAGILDAAGAAVYVGDPKNGLRTQAVYGLPFEAIGSRLRPGEDLAGRVVQRDEPMLTNDYEGLPRRSELTFLPGVRSALSVPMRWGGKLRGALSVFYTRPSLVTREQLDLLAAFAELAAPACSNASAHAGLARVARTDTLTGCLNRAAFQQVLGRELERSGRTGNSLSVTLIDLDDFKQVNERHGHLAGDEVLRRVGQALREAVRPYDHVARYGGDEFAIVVLDADERSARRVASRALGQLSGAQTGLEPDATSGATAGVAEWRPGERAEPLIERADRALLHGKHGGMRGQVLGASGPPLFGADAREDDLEAELQAALSESR